MTAAYSNAAAPRGLIPGIPIDIPTGMPTTVGAVAEQIGV
eukprot:CAMPEP_0169186126 /NCGR_PEP_ID=MMETSP1016-20121227/2183_1 /TAXON_ID=342587 /ORGANISM="Karlodinium micrum, Strain CCMP2283" /LENGTH=39 /DNA_ID= /DNA_START= /DNA_END= /DNA_ORIENTATION=